jgi:hypothetical protein
MVAGYTQDILDIQRPGTQKVGLERQPVSIAAGKLVNGFQPPLDEPGGNGHGADAQYGTLLVRNIDCGNMVAEHLGIVQAFLNVDTFRRPDFTCDNELPFFEFIFQFTHFLY